MQGPKSPAVRYGEAAWLGDLISWGDWGLWDAQDKENVENDMLEERKSKAATPATTATPDRAAVTTGLLTAVIAEQGAASG